jgi:hypothetical protein
MRAWLLAALLLPGCLAPQADRDGDGAAAAEGFADLEGFEPPEGLPGLEPAQPHRCDPTGARHANAWVEPAPAALLPPDELARRLAGAMGVPADAIGPRNETVLSNGVRTVHWNGTGWSIAWALKANGVGVSYQGPMPQEDAGRVLHEAMAAVGHPAPAEDPAGASTDAWARPTFRGRQLMDQSEARLRGPSPHVVVGGLFTLLDGGDLLDEELARAIARAHDRCQAQPADPGRLRFESRLGAHGRTLAYTVQVRDPGSACNGPLRTLVVDAVTGHVLGYRGWDCLESAFVRPVPA